MKFAKRTRKKTEKTRKPSALQPQGPLEVCETDSKKNRKDAKTLRTAATRPFLATIPTPTEDVTRPRATARQICTCTGKKNAKNALSKTSSVLQLQGLFSLETQFHQNFELRKKQNSNTRKKYPQKRSAKSSLFKTSKGVEEVDRRELLLSWRFASVYLFDFVTKRQDSTNEKKPLRKKCANSLENGPCAKSPIPPSAGDNRLSAKCSPPISHCKTSGFRRHGPLINSSRASY